MDYNEKLANVLKSVVMATPEDLDKLHQMTFTMVPDSSAGKQQIDRADLCSYIPFLAENDPELLTSSARMSRRNN